MITRSGTRENVVEFLYSNQGVGLAPRDAKGTTGKR